MNYTVSYLSKNISALFSAQNAGFVKANRNKLKKAFFFGVNKKMEACVSLACLTTTGG